jgi:hypothetical protein
MASYLIQDMNTAAETLPSDISEDERRQLLQTSQKLIESLETPIEATLRFTLAVR